MAKKLLVNGYITQITEREKIDDEEAMFRYEKVLVSASKKVRRTSSQHTYIPSFFLVFVFVFVLVSFVWPISLFLSSFVLVRVLSASPSPRTARINEGRSSPTTTTSKL